VLKRLENVLRSVWPQRNRILIMREPEQLCKRLCIVLSLLKQEGRGLIIGIKPVFALK